MGGGGMGSVAGEVRGGVLFWHCSGVCDPPSIPQVEGVREVTRLPAEGTHAPVSNQPSLQPQCWTSNLLGSSCDLPQLETPLLQI